MPVPGKLLKRCLAGALAVKNQERLESRLSSEVKDCSSDHSNRS
jgi:hypothetical protein